jgi:hypothetical protein
MGGVPNRRELEFSSTRVELINKLIWEKLKIASKSEVVLDWRVNKKLGKNWGPLWATGQSSK